MNAGTEKQNGAIHCEVILPKIVITFLRDGSREFTDRDWIDYIWKGSSKTRFQILQKSRENLLYIRATQGHSGGEMIEVEIMGHTPQLETVCIPQRVFVRSQIHVHYRTHRWRVRRS